MTEPAGSRVAGLLLAAGAGRRFGGPKALAYGGEWLRHALAALVDGGCEPVRVVLGARAEEAAGLLPSRELAVVAADWQRGMSASLRAGLAALNGLMPAPAAVLVHLVDLPDVGAAVVRRLIEHAAEDGGGHGARRVSPAAVVRAGYRGTPGHPVLIGRDHWEAVAAAATGDHGARDWLAGRSDLRLVECSDLATGHDPDFAGGDRGDRADRGDDGDRADRADGGDRADRGDRADGGERGDRGEHGEREQGDFGPTRDRPLA